MRVTHRFTDDSATIRIEGLPGPVRMLHLTDTHMHYYDERDGDMAAGCVDFIRRREAHMEREGVHYVPGDTFREHLARAATEELDLLALTGDIVHFPAPASSRKASPGCRRHRPKTTQSGELPEDSGAAQGGHGRSFFLPGAR